MLLMEHASKGWHEPSETVKGRHYLHVLALQSSRAPASLRAGHFYVLGPQFGGCCPEDAFWVPWDWNNGETVLGRLPSPGHYTESRMSHPQPFYERGLLACPGVSASGEGLRLEHIQRLWKCSQGTQARVHLGTLPLLRYSSPVSPRKECIYSSGFPYLPPRENL